MIIEIETLQEHKIQLAFPLKEGNVIILEYIPRYLSRISESEFDSLIELLSRERARSKMKDAHEQGLRIRNE